MNAVFRKTLQKISPYSEAEEFCKHYMSDKITARAVGYTPIR